MFHVRPFDTNSRAIFQDAVEHAMAQGQIDLRPAGHIAIEERERGGRYAYWMRYNQAKKLTKEYVGPEGSGEHQLASALLESLKQTAAQAKALRALTFAEVDHSTSLVLARLHNLGFFTGGGILVGTHAFRAITNQLGYRFTPAHITHDVDLAWHRVIDIALPNENPTFLGVLKESGLNFVEVPDLKRPPEPATSYKVVGEPLKVDLLVAAPPNQKPFQARQVPELGAYATTMPSLSFLLPDSTMAVTIGRSLIVPVRVPDPARYCLHKIVVADLRPVAETAKILKDIQQAAALAAILSEDDPQHLEDVAREMDGPMRKHVVSKLPVVLKSMGEWPEAADFLQRIVGHSAASTRKPPVK